MDTIRYYLAPLTTFIGAVGLYLGGPFVWMGISVLPVLLLLDVVLPRDTATRKVTSPLLADMTLYLHVVLMFALYAAFLTSVMSGAIDLAGSQWQAIGALLSIGWLSAVPTLPIAHELMHRRHWFPRWTSRILGIFYLDPNRDIGHVMTHHIHLDTPKDADTARRGETIYTFVFRASLGSYLDAIHTEAENLRRYGLSPWNWRNRTYQQVLMIAVLPAISWYVGGGAAALVTIGAMAMGKALVEAFNYFQHYGLVRVGGSEVLKHHAWNHLGAIVRPIGMEITNHINHHLDGYTRYYNLKPEPDAPQMPSLFLCFVTGLIPPVWMNLIAKPRLMEWDRRHASSAERELAASANARAGWQNWLAE